jgi:hypothetical protein
MTEEEQDEILKNSLDLIRQWGEENKPPTLWDIMRNDLGFSIDMCDEIVDAVENKWLPKESTRPSYDTMQWDKCVRMMREKLR